MLGHDRLRLANATGDQLTGVLDVLNHEDAGASPVSLFDRKADRLVLVHVFLEQAQVAVESLPGKAARKRPVQRTNRLTQLLVSGRFLHGLVKRGRSRAAAGDTVASSEPWTAEDPRHNYREIRRALEQLWEGQDEGKPPA
jgi:hypothetical protein